MTQPDWKVCVAEARKETTNRERLIECVMRAEAAIAARALAICDFQGHEAEAAELRAGVEELRKIQIEKLGYPDWTQTQKLSS